MPMCTCSRALFVVLLLVVKATSAIVLPMANEPVTEATTNNWNGNSTEAAAVHEESAIHLAGWNLDYVAEPLAICAFVLLVGIVKLIFHHLSSVRRFKWIASLFSAIPESCILIAFGTGFAAILYFAAGDDGAVRMSSQTFMLFLLPPIVLESAYSLDNRAFSDNIGTILLYAVVGTVINFLIIGFSLWGLFLAGLMGSSVTLTVVECLLFGSLIVAVDPVAVLAIFQETHVNAALYFLVFGESLLNDAVTIVLSNMMKAFSVSATIDAEEIVIGIFSFFTISIGGLLIGLVIGVIITLVTRLTSRVRVVEPLALLFGAYMAYLCAELVHWSGIISAIGCGILEAHYAFGNISDKSRITVVYFIKMLSSACESVVFMFLGLELIRTQQYWDTGFALWTLLLCLVARVVSVFGLTFLVNLRNKVNPIKPREQFIMWYGGLRGAICFAVCSTLSDDLLVKNMFMTTCFFIILVTVFIQGVTIKPLVKYCHITRQDDHVEPLFITVQNQMTDKALPLVEVLIGQRGQNYFRSWVYNVDEKYLKRFLQGKNREVQIVQQYKEMAMKYYETMILSDAGKLYPNSSIEDAIITDIQRELQRQQVSAPSSRKDLEAKDPESLRRILSRSTMWLHDRDQTRERNNTIDSLGSTVAINLHAHYIQNLTNSQRFLTVAHVNPVNLSDEEDADSNNNNNTMQRTTSEISLSKAEQRHIYPSLGANHHLQPTNGPKRIRRHSEVSRPSTAGLSGESAAAAASRYVRRNRSIKETAAASNRLTTLGEETTDEHAQTTVISQQVLAGSNHVNTNHVSLSPGGGGGGEVHNVDADGSARAAGHTILQPNGGIPGIYLLAGDDDVFDDNVDEPATSTRM